MSDWAPNYLAINYPALKDNLGNYQNLGATLMMLSGTSVSAPAARIARARARAD